jgi:hypothetical protein
MFLSGGELKKICQEKIRNEPNERQVHGKPAVNKTMQWLYKHQKPKLK